MIEDELRAAADEADVMELALRRINQASMEAIRLIVEARLDEWSPETASPPRRIYEGDEL